jgi:thioredoxin
MLTPTTSAEFSEILSEATTSQKKVVVDFYASWCGPCKKIAPLFNSLANHYNDSIVFVKVDADQAEEICSLYEIDSLPTFISFKDGAILKRFEGASASELNAMVEK